MSQTLQSAVSSPKEGAKPAVAWPTFAETSAGTRTPPPTEARGPLRRRVIAVLPAFNSEKTLRRTYDAIPKDWIHEVILVDNASTDQTASIAEGIEGLTVIKHETNRGYGGSQKTCYAEALRRGADIVIMIHSDFQYDPRYVPQMVEPIIRGEADMVLGSRFLLEDPRKSGMDWWRYAGNRLLSTLQGMALGVRLSEFHSGYRAYRRELLLSVPFYTFSNDFLFDSQMIAAAARMGFRIGEVPIPTSYHHDCSSLAFLRCVKFGLATLWTLIPTRTRKGERSAPPL